MAVEVKVGGVWTKTTFNWVKVAGVWTKAHTVWTRVAGVWTVVDSGIIILSNHVVSTFQLGPPFDANAGVRLKGTTATIGQMETLNEAGTVWSNHGTGWLSPKGDTVLADNYEAKLTKTSGSHTPAGPTLGVFNAMTADREWTLSRGAAGISTFVGTLEVREIADTANKIVVTVDWRLENEFDI